MRFVIGMVTGLVGRLVIGLLVAALVFGGYWFFLRSDAGDAPKVGECVSVSGPVSDVDVRTTGCDDPSATYKVVDESTTCDPAESQYTISYGSGSLYDACLDYNVAVGDCLLFTSGADPDRKVACSEAKGQPQGAKVLFVSSTSSSAKKCPRKTVTPLSNKTRGSLICFGPA